ncbi:hypothetical protein [Mycobacterium sp. PSTR-4-N]|uniref:hypothetical protein n=1 Tax=Mycobacterium sp. PSTR-4-N TaxID=2917745 RepID=UPI001F14EB56|nr:hypothetical protein [Mycobacterium sp. PSTR-4-N]MCG7596358.1 hypothetical protein [Mycobacterium sp. PSTR-4-N]
MTAPLQAEYKALPAEVFLRLWLLPITVPASIGSKMWATGLPKPYRTVRRISGPRTDYSDTPLMWVHTFGKDYTEAATEADRTDARLQVLVDYPGYSVTMPDGRIATCEWCEITSAAHEEDYSAESVVTRFVSEARFGFSFVPA